MLRDFSFVGSDGGSSGVYDGDPASAPSAGSGAPGGRPEDGGGITCRAAACEHLCGAVQLGQRSLGLHALRLPCAPSRLRHTGLLRHLLLSRQSCAHHRHQQETVCLLSLQLQAQGRKKFPQCNSGDYNTMRMLELGKVERGNDCLFTLVIHNVSLL